jgi:hypothetical protein
MFRGKKFFSEDIFVNLSDFKFEAEKSVLKSANLSRLSPCLNESFRTDSALSNSA